MPSAVSRAAANLGRRGGYATAQRRRAKGLPAHRELTREERIASRIRQQGLEAWMRQQLPWFVACATAAAKIDRHAPSARLLIDVAVSLGIEVPEPAAAVQTLIDRIRCPRCGWRRGRPHAQLARR